jgi:activating signal cointegrator complex subunit 2
VALQQDREAIERMKADILRRVEAMDEEDALSEVSDSELGITRNKARDIAYEEELDEEGPVRVTGDGSAESEVDDDETDREDAKPTPETVLELAYIRDSKLFERDAQTRRAKARTELKQQTGALLSSYIRIMLTSEVQVGQTSRLRGGRSCSSGCRSPSAIGSC